MVEQEEQKGSHVLEVDKERWGGRERGVLEVEGERWRGRERGVLEV